MSRVSIQMYIRHTAINELSKRKKKKQVNYTQFAGAESQEPKKVLLVFAFCFAKKKLCIHRTSSSSIRLFVNFFLSHFYWSNRPVEIFVNIRVRAIHLLSDVTAHRQNL